MTRSVGYNQCSVLVDTNYQTTARYPQVNLSLVKNEPLDPTDYLNGSTPIQQSTYQYVHQQQISPGALILPPTPPSPSDAQFDLAAQSAGHRCNPQLNQISQTNQISRVLSQPTSQTNSSASSQMNKISNQMNGQTNGQVNSRVNDAMNVRPTSQINSQINSQPANQIKNSQHLAPIKPQLMPVQQTIGKYRKKQLHGAKPYNLSSGEQLTRSQLKSGNSISRRNERERRRVRNVNNGFQELRKRIPQGEKKMSKVETLRTAVQYIKDLQDMLNGPNPQKAELPASSTEFLFSILQQNASLNALVHSESSNSQITASQSQGSQQDSSLVDYFDLTELLSQ